MTEHTTHFSGCDCERAKIEELKSQLRECQAREALMVRALRGFNEYCIKPECKCWACLALSQSSDSASKLLDVVRAAENYTIINDTCSDYDIKTARSKLFYFVSVLMASE